MSGRVAPLLVTLAVGVGSGVYIFKPLLDSYEQSTKGTFRPEDDHHSAPVPPLPMTGLAPNQTPAGESVPEFKKTIEEEVVKQDGPAVKG